jgi:hypothetical protein
MSLGPPRIQIIPKFIVGAFYVKYILAVKDQRDRREPMDKKERSERGERIDQKVGKIPE